MTPHAADGLARGWSGHLYIGKGFAVVDGTIGDNAPHRHLAIQMSIGIDGPVTIADETASMLVAGGVLIASNVRHRIAPPGRHVRSLYVEPQSRLGNLLAARLAGRPLDRTDRAFEDALRRWLPGETLLDTDPDAPGPTDPRAVRLMQLIADGDPQEGPARWAQRLAVSPSRLRTLSIEAFGVPPVRLRQWIHLKKAARAMAAGANLAGAAAESGYADQAHFTRQLNRWFGVSPGRGLAGLVIVVDG